MISEEVFHLVFGLQAGGGAEAQQQQQLGSGGGRGLWRLEPQDGEPGRAGGVGGVEEEGANMSNATAENRDWRRGAAGGPKGGGQVTGSVTKNCRSKDSVRYDVLLYLMIEYIYTLVPPLGYSSTPLPVLTVFFFSNLSSLHRCPAAKPRCPTARPCSSHTEGSCSPPQLSLQTGAPSRLPWRWIHGALPSPPPWPVPGVPFWFKDTETVSSVVPAGRRARRSVGSVVKSRGLCRRSGDVREPNGATKMRKTWVWIRFEVYYLCRASHGL